MNSLSATTNSVSIQEHMYVGGALCAELT